ncbi:LuxR C-terminal-related transcriptional regulator [uncultured Desulfobacter sp.]|uniref:LuxR C-terminal-related transcriptional regulator n=1 Tax=uncultured Desulfobacter sp. TaxID=240139 RepID=UPI002AAA6EE0|nr:LuxR C-terminal-related transcriptional regulator [uncultured Desulfobacter sp.]
MIIQTKLTMPPLREKMVQRSQLTGIIEQGKDHSLIFITGQAGAGKTCLAVQWLSRYEKRAAWYSLDNQDNDPDLFSRYLLSAMLTCSKKIAQAFSPFLQGQKTIPIQKAVQRIIDEFVDFKDHFFLVLDDYHAIESTQIHEAIQYLIECAPACLHLVILSRSALPFPTARLTVGNRLIQVSAMDLKFSLDETACFLSDLFNIRLLPEQLKKIFQLTEGWVSGLQLVGLSLNRQPLQDLSRISLKEHKTFAMDYFREEVFRVQPEPVQQFLLKTSILTRFNATLCENITGMKDSGAILEQLDRNNIFIIALDPSREWFRYHALFADSLKKHLKQTHSEQVPDLEKKAALWYAANDHFELAFIHAHASGDIHFLADVLEDHLMFYLLACEFVTIARWLNKIPDALVNQRLILLLYRQLLATEQWNLSQADFLMKNIRDRKDALLSRYTGAKQQRARDLWLAAEHSNAIFKHPDRHDAHQLALDLKTISPGHLYIKMYLLDFIPWSLMESGETQQLAGTVLDNLAFYKQKKLGFGVFNLLRIYASIEITMGHMSRAEEKLKAELDMAKEAGLSKLPFRSDYFVIMAMIHAMRNEPDLALENISSAMAYLEETNLNLIQCDAHIQQACILQAMGRETVASFAMEKALEKSAAMGSPYLLAVAECAAARLALFQGEPSRARQWADGRKLNVNEPFSECFESECLLAAHLWVDQGEYEKAVLLLETLRPRSLKRLRAEPVLRIDILLSAALYRLDRKKEAFLFLECAVCFAVPEKYIQPFILFSAYIGELLLSLQNAADPLIQAHAGELCRQCGLAHGPCRESGKSIPVNSFESLTPREVDILKMMASGHSNNDIAANLFVSVNTVKFYNKNIFAKLEVKNRVQAGIKARKLNII